MSKITVNVLEFHHCDGEPHHIEIVLSETTEKGVLYYNIDGASEPKYKAEIDNGPCLEAIESADKNTSFVIEHNLNQIIAHWKRNYKEIHPFDNNCADTAAWFLETFAEIPNPGACGKPVTCNYVMCGLFAPSFLQCCTLPGRVGDYLQNYLNKNKKDETSSLVGEHRPLSKTMKI